MLCRLVLFAKCYRNIACGTEITVWKTLFSARGGRKIRSCVGYFLSLGTDI